MFALESDMIKPVRVWLDDQKLQVKSEFITPWGICDFVGISLHKRKVAERLRQHQRRAITSFSKITLLQSMPDAQSGTSVTLKHLEKLFAHQFCHSRIADDLAQLVADRYVVSPRNSHFQKLNGWMPLQKRLVAIELKLSRIEEALYQASNNLWFASESYVALPIDRAQRVLASKRRTAFSETGVGLLGVEDKSCEVLLKSNPVSSLTDPLLQALAVERFWRGWLKAVD